MLLGEMLIGQGLATRADIDAALARQQGEGGRLGATLVAMGVLTVDQLLTALRNQREADSALELCRQSLARWQTSYGPRHANTIRAHYNLARALSCAGRAGEALPHAEAAVAGHTALVGSRHACTLEAERLVARIKAVAEMGVPATVE